LKLHAQGPRLFDEAADAYQDLFKSDIFKYPEAKTEYERAELPRITRLLVPNYKGGLCSSRAWAARLFVPT